MNAAFLLVTTAWFAGADPVPTTTTAPAGTASGTVASSPVPGGISYGGTGYGGGCGGTGCGGAGYGGCGCESDCCCKVGCLQKLKARFNRNKCCCESCGCATTSCCNTGCGGNVGGCGSNYGSCGCGCETSCCKPGLCARMKARMHRNNCCCDTCCDSCGGGYGAGVGGVGAPGVMPGSSAEPIKTLPKDATPGNKLPSGKSGGTVQSHGLDLTPASSSIPSF